MFVTQTVVCEPLVLQTASDVCLQNDCKQIRTEWKQKLYTQKQTNKKWWKKKVIN